MCNSPINTRFLIRIWTLSAVALLCVAQTAALASDAANEEEVELEADAAIQRSFEEMAAAPDEATFRAGLEAWLDAAKDDKSAHLLQLVWYAAHHRDDARTKGFVGTLLARLDLSPAIAAGAIAPHLDDRDPAVRDVVGRLLKGYEDRSPTRPPDFSAYRAVVEAEVRAGREPRPSLVRFMYASDAGAALLAMIRAHQLRDPEEIKPILWAEHVVSELMWLRRYGFIERDAVDPAALQEIRNLARHERWWVRLYVAQMIGQHPELGDMGMVKTLLSDSHEVVRKTMMSFQAFTKPAPKNG